MRLFFLLAAVASGYWTGTVTTPAGALPIGIAITGDSATLDAPSLGYTDKPLRASFRRASRPDRSVAQAR